MKWVIWNLATLAIWASTVLADPALDKVVDLYSFRACGGCHMGETAETSLAHFTTVGGTRELLKSFAYHHYKMRDRVAKELGPNIVTEDHFLELPTIDPLANGGKNHGSLDRITTSLERDGDEVTPEESQVLANWLDEGAPLPQDVMDEVFGQIRVEYRGDTTAKKDAATSTLDFPVVIDGNSITSPFPTDSFQLSGSPHNLYRSFSWSRHFLRSN